MGYPLPKLTRKNQHNFFGVQVKHGDMINYSQAFMFRDVGILAQKHGYSVRYATQPERMMHGSFTCRVISIEEAMKEEENKEGTVKNIIKMKDILGKFEEKKEEAARVRDELRHIASEVQEVAQSFEDGVDGLEEAIDTMQRALDDMSTYV